MTYAVDFKHHYDRGDYRFFLRRKRGKVSAAKVQLYSLGKVDSVSEEPVEYEDLPDDLQSIYRILKNGDMPLLVRELT